MAIARNKTGPCFRRLISLIPLFSTAYGRATASRGDPKLGLMAEFLLGPGCVIVPARDAAFHLVPDVLHFFSNRIARFLAACRGQQQAGSYTHSHARSKQKHMAECV